MTAFHRHKKKIYVGGGVIVFGMVLAASLLAMGFYPVAAANGCIITARRFNADSEAAALYYANVIKTYAASSSRPNAPTEDQIRAGVLSQLVEAELIRQAVQKEVGKDRNYLVQSKVSKYEENADLQKAAPTLYGMSFDNFRSEVLVPQAERDIMAGRLFLQGKNINAWLKDQKKSAQVKIFDSKFRWTGEQVEIKK